MDFLTAFLLSVLAGLLIGGGIFYVWRSMQSRSRRSHATWKVLAGDDPLQRRLKELAILNAIATATAEVADEDTLIERATEIIGENLYPDNFGVLLVDERAGTVTPHPSYREREKGKEAIALPLGKGICGRVALDGKPRRAEDVSRDPDYYQVDELTRSELCVPLRIGERVIGVINAESEEIGGFNRSDEQLLSTIAGQLATAIERLRAEAALRRRASQLAILSRVSQEIAASLVPGQVYPAIHRAASQLMNAETFLIVLHDASRDQLVPVYFMDRGYPVDAPPIPVGTGLSGHVISTGEALLINDRDELGDIQIIQAGDAEATRSILAVPLRLGEKIFGMLSCQSYQPYAYDLEDQQTLSLLANQAATAIENARLFEETQHRLAEVTFLSQIIAVTATESDLTIALNRICAELAYFLRVPQVEFALLNSQLTAAQVIAAYRVDGRIQSIGTQIPVVGNSALAFILEGGSHLVVEDIAIHPLFEAARELYLQKGIISLLMVPIVFAGEVVGTLEISAAERRSFTAGEISLVEKVASQVGQVLERLGLFAATREQAERMAQLAMISEGLNQPLSQAEVIKSIGEGALMLSEADRVAIFITDEDRGVVPAWQRGLPESYLEQVAGQGEEMLAGVLPRGTEPVLIPDLEVFPPESLLRGQGIKWGWRGIEIWPLVYKGDPVAAIACYFDQPHFSSDAEQEVMQAFTRQAAVALVNARLFEETRRRTVQLESLNAIITAVAAASEVEDLLKTALDHLLRALGVTAGAIWVGNQQILKGVGEEFVQGCREITDRAVKEEAGSYVIHDLQASTNDERWSGYRELLKREHACASIIMPLISENRHVGCLAVLSQQARRWLSEEVALVEGIGFQLGGAIERISLLEKIRENARRVQQIIDTVPEGVILVDHQQTIVLANPMAQIFLQEAAFAGPGDKLTQLGKQGIMEFLTGDGQPLWHEIVLDDHKRRIFELAARPLQMNGTASGWVIVVRDVTQERENQTRIQMQERLATVGQLAAGIAHDFNNILAAIVVYTDLLTRDPHLSPASKERLTVIQQQVQRAASLIRQILDFSRRSVMEQSTIDLLPFIKELDKLLQRVLPESIRVELTYQPGKYFAHADPARLQQVFMNLAVNARDASPQGGVIRFRLEKIRINEGEQPPCPEVPPGSWIRMTVKDSGEGIPAEALPHVFEPFFTTKPIGQGTGLGLAQAYGIIKQHEGYIDVHSQLGEGTTFHIYLPEKEIIGEEESEMTTLVEIKGGGETILLVEDDHATREAMRTLLEDSNYRVLSAANGAEALQIFNEKEEAIDLIVSDMVMPVMGGMALYQALQMRRPGIKMLFITGHPIQDRDKIVLETGNVSWLQKPFSISVFNQAIYELLHGGQPDRGLIQEIA